MLLAAVEKVRAWGVRNKRLLGSLVGIAVEGAVKCVPGVGWAGDALGEMAKNGVVRLLDPDAEIPGVKKAGETISAEQLAQLNAWLEQVTASYGGLIERLDAVVGDIESRNDAELLTLVKRTLTEHEDLARAFDASARDIRRITLSLAGIERRLDQHCHILHGVSASLEEIKGMLADAPLMSDWAKLRQARPDALEAILQADDHFLAGRRDQGMQALLSLLAQRGVGHETLCHQMGLVYMAGGQVDRAEKMLSEATSGGVPSPAVARALSNTSTGTGRTRGPAAWSTLPAGLVINRRYRIEAEVGRGGMASVYRAAGVDRLNRGQVVAVKVPAPDLMRNEQTCDRFVQEILVSQRLSQGGPPTIVQTIGYEVFEDPRDSSELYGLVLEFVKGRSLADFLAERRIRRQSLSIAEVLHFMEPVCQALAYAHEQTPSILHRDVKPHNVMVTSKGEVKLMDFGIARVLDESAGGHLTSAPVGTPVYMPPEFLNPTIGVDARSDVYLAGNLLLELLTMHPMGDLETRKDCPPAWMDLVNDSMSRVRLKRPATAREFLDRLRAGIPTAQAAASPLMNRVSDFFSRLRGGGPAPSAPAAIPVPPAGQTPAPPPPAAPVPAAPPPAPAPADPALGVDPPFVELTGLAPGRDTTFTIWLHNAGAGEITGTIESEVPWLQVPDTPHFCFSKKVDVEVRVLGKTLRAQPKPYIGRLVVQSSGGDALIEVRAHATPRPFPDGVLAGIDSPRRLAEAVQKHPMEAAALFESGEVARWYERNGWAYPVQGPRATGLGAVQQYFEALGLTKPPALRLSTDEVRMVGRPGGSVQHTLTLGTGERKPVYAQAASNKAWLVVERVQQAGQEARIFLNVPQVPGSPGDVWLAEVEVVGNGGQRFTATVQLDVREPTAPPPPVACVNPMCGQYSPGDVRHCRYCGTPILGMPGMVVKGRYRLGELVSLTEGVAVYRATDVTEGDQPVLLEDVVDVRPRYFEGRLEHIRKHVGRLKELQPVPQIPRVYDLIEEQRAVLVAREEIKGKSLLEALSVQPSGRFRFAQVTAWAAELCDMLAFMHSLTPPVLCAVLRPEDLVLEPDGRTLRLPQPTRQILPALEPSAARYAAPEVWAAKAEPRSAQFSLAATLFQLATGEQPNAAATGVLLRGRLDKGAIAGDERAFYQALAKALAEDPGERHESARAMRAALGGGA